MSTSRRRCGLRALVRDSVGLSGADRQRNIAGRVKIIKPVARAKCCVVDDIVTTGATATESVRVLHVSGARRGRRACDRQCLTTGGNFDPNQPRVKN